MLTLNPGTQLKMTKCSYLGRKSKWQYYQRPAWPNLPSSTRSLPKLGIMLRQMVTKNPLLAMLIKLSLNLTLSLVLPKDTISIWLIVLALIKL